MYPGSWAWCRPSSTRPRSEPPWPKSGSPGLESSFARGLCELGQVCGEGGAATDGGEGHPRLDFEGLHQQRALLPGVNQMQAIGEDCHSSPITLFATMGRDYFLSAEDRVATRQAR